MAFKQGTVVLIPFPFSDLTGLKQRPALVMSSEESQQETRQVICMMITSTVATLSTDYSLTSWQQSGLLKPSVVKVNRVFTINSELVKRAMGELPGHDVEQIKLRLFQILGFQKEKD
ncbi:type II toxin-antitoxin system PemK/MazF family toxin [Ferviditalea candida]|uniref:Type II toxin-antitoxin system PemK/MazF family toxin n=1 Tax=Ferviditalea candida TaxID=3108399 RepID=A0ABU5ZJY1_9BACL|nr:type II toxin-antitoxin system PemK/MazF family toxin [Paenibacillaceae bacterium T2]